ncbi:MAG: glycosyltransferase family 4 protein [Burkholderiaceae bacterium]|nr:glycosyltransferase family 4 protein [Burkholderiaceae bacterium]
MAKRSSGIVGLHLYPSDLTHESRIEKMVAWLVEARLFSRIYVVGISGRADAQVRKQRRGICFVRLKKGQADNRRPFVKTIQFLAWFVRIGALARRTRPACIHPHSLSVLPIAVLIKVVYRIPLVYEAHELETEVKTAKGSRRTILKVLERSLIRFADEVVVVSDLIADWYADTYSIRRPYVVRNVPEAPPDDARRFGLRRRLDLPEDALVAVYLGSVAPGRRVEWVIERWNQVSERWHFVVVGDGPSLAYCRQIAEGLPNVHFHPLVLPSEVLALAREADIGFCMLDADCLSYKFSLPNKFFEYAMAGVPIVANELPEMAALIRREDAGWVVPDEDDLSFLDSLRQDEMRRKATNAGRLGRSLSWKAEVETLRPAYERIVGREHRNSRRLAR